MAPDPAVPTVAVVEGARRFAVWVEVRGGVPVVIKQGWGPVASAALQREAAVLEAFRHPGVVDVVAVESSPSGAAEHSRLTTRFAGSHTLRTAPPAGGALLILRTGQVLATLAALHGRGLLHGAIDPSHVVVGPTGSARWCGLGRVRTAPPASLLEESRAVAHLASEHLSDARLPRRRVSAEARAERRLVAEATAVLADGRLDAGGLASALTALLPVGPPRDQRVPRRASAQPDGDLIGQQPARNGEDEVIPPPFHQPVQDPTDLLR